MIWSTIIGLGTATLGYSAVNRPKYEIASPPKPGPTEAPKPVTAQKSTEIPKPTSSPLVVAPISTVRSDPYDIYRAAFPNIHPTSENRPRGTSSIDDARAILGDDFLGPAAIRNAFKKGFLIPEIPQVPSDFI